MKIVVCLKQVPSTESRIKPGADGRSADLSAVDWVVNPYDEYALEEALRLKEKRGGEVIVLSLGGEKVEDAMRSALALGADRAVILKDPAWAAADALQTSAALAALARRENADIILCGKQAVDDDLMAVPAMLAERLDLPQALVVVKLDIAEDGRSATAVREVEGGHEHLAFPLPAVVAAQKGLNEPRYANLKGIMAAKKKPIETVTAAALGLGAPVSLVQVVEVVPPSTERKGRLIAGDGAAQARELVRILHEEEKII